MVEDRLTASRVDRTLPLFSPPFAAPQAQLARLATVRGGQPALSQQIAESDASVSCFPEDGKTYEELYSSAIRKIMSPPDEMAAYLYPTSEGSLSVAATNIMPPFFSHASASAKG